MKTCSDILMILCFLLVMGYQQELHAQQYTGTSGLIHVPSADMDRTGDVRVGVHFLNKEFTPDILVYDNAKYHTMTHYLSITPFRWLEIGYTCTLLRSFKIRNGVEYPNEVGLYRKDRYFSVKLQPICEKVGKWWPSIAIGSNDPYSSDRKSTRNNFFSNIYIAMSKHFICGENVWGLHVAYRDWKHAENNKWKGIVGGFTYRPSFARNLRAIAEYTGNEINIGADYLLWRHFLLQASLQDGKYFSGGVCFQINLL